MLTHSSSRGQLLMPLLSRNTSCQEEEFRKKIVEYDPFKSPPDFHLVEMHAKACLVGKFQGQADPDLCPCCNNYVTKGNMNINCSDQELDFLGSAYPLFFRMTIYFGVLITLLFVFGGSLRVLIHNWECNDDKCVRFFGFMVIMDSTNEDKYLNGQWYDLLTALILMTAVLIIQGFISSNISDFNISFLDPASYSIAMKNLPLNVTKDEIIQFLNSVLIRDQIQIEKINFVYSVDEYFNAFNTKISCLTKINKLNLKLRDSFADESQKPKLQKQLEETKRVLKEQEMQLEKFSKECEVEGNSENFTGTAFVTFNKQKILQPILSLWGNNIRKSLQHFLFGWWYQSPYEYFKGNPLIITKAPSPTDILWDNQKFSFLRTYINNSLMFLVAISILFASFYLQFIIMKIVYPFRKNANQDFIKRIQAYSMSLIVVIVNTVLRLVVQYFTQLQKLDSQAHFNQHYVNRYTTLLFLNSAFMPYLIHKRWDDDIQISSSLLLQDINFLFLTNAFSEPIAKIFNVFWFHRIFMRKMIRKYEARDCPYTQHEANYWHEGPTFNIANSYAFIARTLFLCTWYASIAPYGLIFSLVGLIFNYYVDRILLLRYCSCPETQNEQIFSEIIGSLQFLPIIFICGVIQFQNRTKLDVNENLVVFFGQYFEYGLTSVAMFVSFIGYILIKNIKKKEKDSEFSMKFDIPYQEAREDFRTEYDKVNPITSFRANMEWTKALNKKRVNNIGVNTANLAHQRQTFRITIGGLNYGGARASTIMHRNSSVNSLIAHRQKIPIPNNRSPTTTSPKAQEMQTFKFL